MSYSLFSENALILEKLGELENLQSRDQIYLLSEDIRFTFFLIHLLEMTSFGRLSTAT